MSSGTELVPAADPKVPATVPEYLVFQLAAAEVQSIIDENLSGETLGLNDLDKVKVPSGGGTVWEVPSLEGTTATKELDGIIVHRQRCRAYYANPYTGEGVPPDCFSDDGVVGICPNPDLGLGGPCEDCPMSKYESEVRQDGKKGRGQACKEQLNVFLLRKDSMLPLVLNLPPTSLKPMKDFMKRLTSAGMLAHHVETRFTLSKEKNDDGVAYSLVSATMIRRLEGGEVTAISGLVAAIKPILTRVRTSRPQATAPAQEEQPQG